jgi:hypothetical protein
MAELDDDWTSVGDESESDSETFEDEETLEFVITSADEEEESTWQWDGHDWRRLS